MKEYQDSLQHISPSLEGQAQYIVANRPGEGGLPGYTNEKLIPLQVLEFFSISL